VCVNKADTNPEITGQIERFCEKQALRFVGRIPYDSEAINAINKGQSIVEIDCPSGEAVRDVYKRTMALLFDEEGETEQ
jgi:MinD superfamily P-loop ATPase